MKIKWMVQGLVGAILLLAGTQAYAATYYFSTSGNNTTGNGSQANPWNSLCGPYNGAGCQTGENKISLKQITVNPGDQLLFKRGDEWKGMDAVWTINTVGTPAAPITFGAWGDTNLPRPIFRGARSAFELGKDNWTNLPGTSIWYTTGINWWPNMAAQEATAPQGPQLYGAWSVQGYTNANAWLDNQSMVRGTYFYEDSTDRLYVWRTDNLKPDHAAGRDIYIGEAPNDGTNRLVKVDRGYAGSSTAAQYVGGNYIFQDLHVKMSRAYGFSTSYPNTQYINCLSEMNGMEGFLFDKVRFGAPSPGSKDGVMRNIVSRRNNLAQGGSIGQGITIEAENVWMYDSESYENGFAGLDFLDFNANTKTDGGGIVNSKLYNNGIQPVSMYSFDANIYIDGGSNITIRDTQVWGAGIDPRGVKTRLRPNVGIAIDLEEPAFAAGRRPHGIKIINTASFANAGSAIGIGAGNGLQSAVESFSDIQIIGCTLQRQMNDSSIPGYYGPEYYDAGIRVVQFDNITSGFVFKNNIVIALNTAQAPIFGSISMKNAGKSKMDFDRNIYYCPGCNFNTNGGYSSGGFFSYDYISNLTIDQFRNVGAAASLQQDQTLSKSVITSNPLLASASSPNFDARLLSGSPALDIAATSVFPFTMSGSTSSGGAADNPYNDLGYHYPLTGTPPPPPPPDTQAPSAPALFTAVQLPLVNTVAMAWLPSTDNVSVAGYQIFDGANQLGTTASLGFSFISAVPGQAYNFLVKAFDAASNTSSPSNTVTLTVGAPSPDTTPPTVPAGLAASVNGTTANLSWSASTDNLAVTGYQVFEGAVLKGTTASLSYAVTALSDGAHTFTVRATDAANNVSNASNSASVTVAAPSGYGPPTNVAAVYVNDRVQLTWTAVTGAAGYNVFRNGVNRGSVTTNSYNDNAVTPGSTYTYTLNSYNFVVETAMSSPVVITVPAGVDTTAPSAPTGLTASVSTLQVTLSWTASTDNVGVAGYEIMNNGQLLGTSVSTSFVYNAASSTTYNFTVRAGDASSNMSSSSAIVTVTMPAPPPAGPTAPSNLVGNVVGTQVQLSWSPATNHIGYNVYRDDVYLKTIGTLSTFDNAVSAGITYRYKVQAYDANDVRSAFSNQVTLTIPGTPADTTAPSVPANLTGTLSGTAINLSWSASTDNVGVSNYKVFNGSLQIGTSTSTSYAVTGVTAGTTYTLAVRGCDAASNCSVSSNLVTIAVPATPSGPGVPTNLVGAFVNNQVQLTWNSAANAFGYNIFRNGAYLNSMGQTFYNDTTIAVGTTYTYTVAAYDAGAVESAPSSPVVIAAGVPTGPPDNSSPTMPKSLTASVNGTTANLSWSASSDNVGVSGYQIFEDETLKGTSATTSYAVTGLSNGSHPFMVRATDAAGNLGPFGYIVTVTITGPADTTAPSAPSNLTASLNNTTANLSWSASTDNIGVTGYQVFDGASQMGTTSSLNYTATGLSNGGHAFTVKAVDGASNLSASSNAASVTVVPPPPDTTSPSAPSNLAASVNGTTANLSWSASTDNIGVTGYQVFDGATQKGTTTSLNYAVTGLSNGSHTFTVRAMDAASNLSASSNSASGTVTGPPDNSSPTMPKSLTASVNGTTANLSWSASSDNVGVSGYQIFEDETLKGTSATTSYAVTGLSNGSHPFMVRATDAAGNLGPFGYIVTVTITGPADTTAPSAPSNLTASLNNTTANLSWSASTDNIGVTGYQVFDGASQMGTTSSLNYTATGLSNGGHAFTVKAVDGASNLSASSNAASVTVVPPPPDTTSPSAPSNLAASVNGTTANLSWSASTDNIGVTGYQVFDGATQKGTTTSLNYAVTGLSNGSHTFTVRAMDAASNLSASSNSASGTVTGPPDNSSPTMPKSLTASVNGTTANLSWSASSDNVGVSGYQIFEDETLKGTSATTSYAVTGLSSGSHPFMVRATDAAGNLGPFGYIVTVTITGPADTSIPSIPSNLAASVSGTTVNLSWSASSDNVGVSGYDILNNGVMIGTRTTNSFAYSGTAGASYSFAVRAFDAAGNTSSSSVPVAVTIPVQAGPPDYSAPTMPKNLTVSVNGTTANLSWSASSDNVGVTGYQIYEDETLKGTSSSTSYAVTGLSSGSHPFMVRAVDAAGNLGPFGYIVTVTIP